LSVTLICAAGGMYPIRLFAPLAASVAKDAAARSKTAPARRKRSPHLCRRLGQNDRVSKPRPDTMSNALTVAWNCRVVMRS